MENLLKKRETYERYKSQREIDKTLIKEAKAISWTEFVDKMKRELQVNSKMYKTVTHSKKEQTTYRTKKDKH